MRFGLALAVLTLGACANVLRGDPHPNIAFKEVSTQSLALKLAPDIKSAVTLSPHEGVAPLTLDHWRGTLVSGFRNGFTAGFEILYVTEPSKGDLRLEISRAELSFAPNSTSTNDVLVINASITYDAKLIDASGKTLKVSAGTVVSKAPITQALGMDVTRCASSAVETMYEAMTKDLF